MGAGFLEAFFPRRCLQDFMPRSPEDRFSQDEKLRVIVDNEYFALIIYFLPLFIYYKEETRWCQLLQKHHYSLTILLWEGSLFISSKRIEKAERRITTGQLNKYTYI